MPISCDCPTHESTVRLMHEVGCSFLKSTGILYACCDNIMPLGKHNDWCVKHEADKPKPRTKAIWIKLVTYYGDLEWIEETRTDSLPEGTKMLRGNNSIAVRTLYTGEGS